MHAAPPLAKSPLISSYSSKKSLAKISVAHFTKWFIIYFVCWWVEDVSFSISPCQALCAIGYLFDCPNIVCLILFSNISQTPKKNVPSQLEKILRYSKETEPEVFVNTYPYTNLALACNVISAYLNWSGDQAHN